MDDGTDRSAGYSQKNMIRLSEIRVELDDLDNKEKLFKKAIKTLKLSANQVKIITVSKRSIDSRKKEDIFYSYAVDVEVEGNEEALLKRINTKKASVVREDEYCLPENRSKSSLRPVIVGFGPAGIFAALTLARAGMKPIVLERGNDVDTRIEDVKSFFSKRKLCLVYLMRRVI